MHKNALGAGVWPAAERCRAVISAPLLGRSHRVRQEVRAALPRGSLAVRAGWVNLPLPAQAFTGARLRYRALAVTLYYQQARNSREEVTEIGRRTTTPKVPKKLTWRREEVRTRRLVIGNSKNPLTLEHGLEAPGRSRWRRRELWCLSGPCCSERRARWAEKVGKLSQLFSPLTAPLSAEWTLGLKGISKQSPWVIFE